MGQQKAHYYRRNKCNSNCSVECDWEKCCQLQNIKFLWHHA